MQKTTIYLVRHGQTEWNIKQRIQGNMPIPLSKTGHKQVKTLGQIFRCISIHAVHSSPVRRTMDTAKEILANPIPCPEFEERKMGALEGLTLKEVKERIPDIERQWARDKIDWTPPGGGETVREFQQRCISAFKKLLKENKGKTILIVTHGGVIRSILHWLHGGKPEEFFHVLAPENAETVKITYNGKYCIEHKKINDTNWKKYLYKKHAKPLF